MKNKLTLFICLLLTVSLFSACFEVDWGEDGYRTMPLGTGTEAPATIETVPPETTAEIPEITTAPETTVAPEVTDEVTTSAPVITTAPETTPEETEPPAVIVTYEFEVIESVTDLGTTGGIKCSAIIRYPALTGLEDKAKQQEVNDLLSQIAGVEYQNRLPNAGELIPAGTAVSYVITETAVTYLGNNLLSVRSEGIIDYIDDANDEEFVYCNLINLSTARDITLKKTYADFGRVIELFTSGKFKQISGDSSLTTAISLEGLMDQYKYHAQYGTFPETYFTHDSLVLVVETNRENGFFAEFSIPLSEVADCLHYSPIK
ncbi:MAG: hypothetical protein IIX44_02090 [Clostridia bacterium]|nr:hypothetical protein [Clostridia bacterium]